MKILIACEESQRVCIAFRKKGHEAYSCDILPCSGGHPEWHIQGNVLDHLEENWDKYVEIDRMESHESFEIMEDFAESIDDARLQEKLFHALNKSKPFRNFKWVIDNSGEYRQRWFDFKKARYIQIVKDKIERLNNYEENV